MQKERECKYKTSTNYNYLINKEAIDMTGKTHMAVGVGVATLLLPANDAKTIIGGTTLALIGSLIVDIDTDKSKGAVLLKEAFGGAVILMILGVILKAKFNINVLNYISENKTITQMFPALAILVIVLTIGKFSSHRGFTHSLIGIVAYAVPVYMLVGSLYIWFLIGYIAHILADMLNKKEVRLLYPLKNGVCLKICSANGVVDKILFISFIAITVLKYISDLNIIHNT